MLTDQDNQEDENQQGNTKPCPNTRANSACRARCRTDWRRQDGQIEAARSQITARVIDRSHNQVNSLEKEGIRLMSLYHCVDLNVVADKRFLPIYLDVKHSFFDLSSET
jgi:hypothetical protein